jgi:hypothetical protein
MPDQNENSIFGSSANSTNYITPQVRKDSLKINPQTQRNIKELTNNFLEFEYNINTNKLIKLFWSLMFYICNLLKRPKEYEGFFLNIKEGKVELIEFLKSMTNLTLRKECPILGYQAHQVLLNFLKFSGNKTNNFIKKSKSTTL